MNKLVKKYLKIGAGAAGFAVAGQVGSFLVQNSASNQRAYLGSQQYDARYGTSADTASSIVSGAGLLFGGLHLIGKSPVQNLANMAKKKAKSVVASRRYNKYKTRLGMTEKQIGDFRRHPPDRPFTKDQARLLQSIKRKDDIFRSRFIGPISGTAIATGALGAIGGTALAYPAAVAGTGAAIATLGLVAAPGSRRFIGRHIGKIGAGIGTVAAGGAIGSSRLPYPAAEGQITDFQQSRQSTTSRLNYSTAGLLQNIHNNRRIQ